MIRFICFGFIILLFSCCKTTTPKTVKSHTFKEGLIVFEKYTSADENSKNEVNKLFNLLVQDANSQSNIQHSKAELTMFKNMVLNDMLQEDKSELTIKVQKDTIWRFKKQGQNFVEYNRIGRNNGFLHYYQYPNLSSESLRYFELFKKEVECEIKIDKQERKKILGYDCYKVTLIPKIEKIPGGVDELLGDRVYDMYVTEQIELPLHSLINFGKFYPFFPLEVISYDSNLKGLKENYKVKTVETK